MSRVLSMTFLTQGGEKSTIRLTDVKSTYISKADIATLMTLILSKNIFTTGSGSFVSKYKASIIDTGVVEYASL